MTTVPAIHLFPNIPAGGSARAGCAPLARRGETGSLRRKALDLKTARRHGFAA